MFQNFKDYLTERTKHSHGIVSDDKGFANRDYDGDLSLKPKPQQRLQPEDYYAPNAQKNPGLMTADGPDRGKPFGDMSSGGLTPKNSMPNGQKPTEKIKKIGGKKKKKLPTKKAMKVEQFLDKTKKMSDVQFTKSMLENVKKVPTPVVRDLYGREYVPEPAQTIKYIANLMITNENMMRRMVRELKRNEGFSLLVAEILSHPETYDYLNEAARGEFGKFVAQKMSMFFEGVSPPRNSGPASAGSPGGGGSAGGGGAGMGGAGKTTGGAFSGGADNGGGFNITGGGSGGGMSGGMQGMGEDEMGMGGGTGMGAGMDDSGGDMNFDDDEHHDDDDHDEDDDDHDEGDDDFDDEDDDEELSDDEDDDFDDEDDEDDDHNQMKPPMNGPGGPPGGGGMMGGGGGGGMPGMGM